MSFVRLRRLRETGKMREFTAETHLEAKNFIMPYFVTKGKGKKELIKAMPGIYRLSIDNLVEDINEAKNLGIRAVLLFGAADVKDEIGREAYNKKGVVQMAVKRIKKEIKDMIVITDVCLCPYTSHGHCGIVKKSPQKVHGPWSMDHGLIYNDATIKILAKTAVSHAESGADLVAPSAMMDGQVSAIRYDLDKNDFEHVGILAYSAKYASNFYWPFREALRSRPGFGDRKSYQMDYRNSDEAMREIEEDINEGADIVMVKPALAYLDIVQRARQNFNIPIAAYNVSGEYAMVKAYSRDSGFGIRGSETDIEKNLVLEILTAIKRAGADLIITYHAKEAARWLK